MITLVQVSDCHLFKDRQKVGYNQINPYQSLTAILRMVSTHQPDMLLVTGDISADGSEQSYQHFKALVEQFALLDKLAVIAGNHDNTLWFDQLLGPFDLAKQPAKVLSDWSVHGVDTRFKGTLGHLGSQQVNRLQSALEHSQTPFQIVACHHHPIACGGWMDKHEWINRQQFTQLISQHAQVKAVVYGHIHTQQLTRVANQIYASCPSSCWQWSTQPEFAIDASLPGYNVLTLDNNGDVEIETLRLK